MAELVIDKNLTPAELFTTATNMYCKTGESSFLVCCDLETLFDFKSQLIGSDGKPFPLEIPEDEPTVMMLGGYKFAFVTSYCVPNGKFILK